MPFHICTGGEGRGGEGTAGGGRVSSRLRLRTGERKESGRKESSRSAFLPLHALLRCRQHEHGELLGVLQRMPLALQRTNVQACRGRWQVPERAAVQENAAGQAPPANDCATAGARAVQRACAMQRTRAVQRARAVQPAGQSWWPMIVAPNASAAQCPRGMAVPEYRRN